MIYPKKITITEVGPRDGLQNEKTLVPLETKRELIHLLNQTGLQQIETTSFVSHKSIPQLADGEALFQSIEKTPNISYSALVPNERGLERALAVGVKHIALFTAASEAFNEHNIHCSIADSIERFKPIMRIAKEQNLYVRAYISCVLGCPYTGHIKPEQVCTVLNQLKDLGVDEFSLGDTIGVGTPLQTELLLENVLKHTTSSKLIMHFHDTYGQAIANIYASLAFGIHHFDSAVAGIGGCPYARGSTGNVATEDVLYLMHGLGIETGIDIFKIVKAGDFICKALKRTNQSKVANALLANPC
jgi:hydroxymethylglutaryl-CoA lyase